MPGPGQKAVLTWSVCVSLVGVLSLMISFIFTIVTSLSAYGCYPHFHTLTLLYVLDHKLLEGAAGEHHGKLLAAADDGRLAGDLGCKYVVHFCLLY